MRAVFKLAAIPISAVTIGAGTALAGTQAPPTADPAPAVRTPADRPEVTTVQEVSDRPLLRLGDRGQAVAAWQRQQNILSNKGLIVDGIYGSTTEQATLDFQRYLGLRADGIVGENTRGVMRYLLAVTRDYTRLATYETFEVDSYQSEGGFCVEVLAGDDWNVECGPLPPYPVSAQVIQMDASQDVLLGSADMTIARVEVELTSGARVDADLTRDVLGTGRTVWTTATDPAGVYAIRAFANDGSEVRAIVLEGDNPIQVLERGDTGPAVAAWQGLLNRVTGDSLATDGVFGENTVQATRNFQAFFGLTADGIVGPQTRGLAEYLAGVA